MEKRYRKQFYFSSTVLIILFIVAATIRLLPYKNFIDKSGQFHFYGPDSYDHLRQISLSITQFPSLPTFDFYYGYPKGTGVVWSPLFDLTIAFFVFISTLGNPTPFQIEAFSFFIPPIVGALAVFPLYTWVSRTFDRNTGLLSAAILCILPGHIVYSLVSEIDHHVLEPILALMLFNSFLSALTYAKSLEGRGSRLTIGHGYLLKAFLCGTILALNLFYWRGATIFWGAIMVFAFLQLVLDIRFGRNYRHIYNTTMMSLLTAAIILTLFCIVNPLNLPMNMRFGVISWFHPLLLLSYSIFLSIVVYIAKTVHAHKVSWRRASILAILLTTAIIGISFSPLFKNLFQGILVIGGRDPWLDNISELRSMLFPQKRLDIMNPALELTWMFWLSPIILLYLGYKAYQDRFENPYVNLFLIWVPYSLSIAIFRERYVHIAALGMASLLAYLFFQMLEATRPLGGYGKTLSVTALLVIISPTTSYIRSIPQISLEEWRMEDLNDSMKWLRTNTPKTSYYENPSSLPEYGILADWGIGSYIRYMGERPTVATNFGWETYGLTPSTEFLTATSEEMGNAILNENRVRYVITQNPIGRLYNSAEIAGRNPNSYLPGGPAFAQSLFIRLHMFDGTDTNWEGKEVSSLKHYRLAYESPNFVKNSPLPMTSVIKIFEYVPGAIVSGKANVRELITAEVIIKTNRERKFIYTNSTRANEKGVFEMTLPYSTINTPYAASATGPYWVKVGNREMILNVTEEDVITSKRLQL